LRSNLRIVMAGAWPASHVFRGREPLLLLTAFPID
jgi:hypothetical protein